MPQAGVASLLMAERAAMMQRPFGVAINNADDDEDEDDFEEVPSDKEALPRAPPLAPSAAPLMRPLSPESSPRDLPPHQKITGYCANPGSLPVEGHNEEEEWFARQRLTGAIGRLVRYNEAEITPKDDILGLRCTRRGRIMVTAVRENGIAAKAGVVAGDELVSIDGRKEFVGHPAHVVHASLRAPVTLVFLGFVGKLQAEVRVKRPPEPKCGLAPGTEILVASVDKQQPPPIKLCDAVVFQQGESPSLLITASATGYKIGEKVQMRHAAGQEWQDGEVTCVAPLKVKISSGISDGNGYEWRDVRRPLSQERPAPVPEEHAAVNAADPAFGKTITFELQREDARNLIKGLNAVNTTAAL